MAKRQPAPLIAGGEVLEVRALPDGVDLKVQGGCGNPHCVSCRGMKVICWTKIAPTNCRIAVGDIVFWRGPRLYWKTPRVSFERMGKYRRVREVPKEG